MRLFAHILTAMPLLLTFAGADAQELRKGHPTIFSTPLLKLSQVSCTKEQTTTFVNEKGEVIVPVCKSQYTTCLMEGACIVEDADGHRDVLTLVGYNISLERQVFGQLSVSKGKCLYGSGYGKDENGKGKRTCLDPYFSVAADRKVHRIGDVIFVKRLQGLELPTGEIHDGYLIVRDTSKSMDDRGRDSFAFFSGMETDRDIHNPFVKEMLDSTDYTFEYVEVAGEEADQVRARRNYPSLPARLSKGFYK